MASFDSHILQAKNNLDFLLAINLINNINWDWQVTIAYYVGVHIVNAHIIGTSNMHYRAHHEVKNVLYNDSSIPEDIYLAYAKLEGLSRRARYLISEDSNNHSQSWFWGGLRWKRVRRNWRYGVAHLGLGGMRFRRLESEFLKSES